MRFAGTAFAHQHHRFSALNVAAFGQFANLRRRNLSRLVEVELFQRLQPRQFCIAQPLLNGVPVAFFRLHREQSFQVADVTALFLDRLLRQLHEVRSNHRNAQRLAVLLYAGMFESLSLLFHRATSAVLAAMLSNWSYSFISGNGRSQRSSPFSSSNSLRGRLSSVAVSKCRTAAVSVQPKASAFSTACCRRSQPCRLPSVSKSIISRVPGCLPCRSCKLSQSRSKLSGQRPRSRHCRSGLDPARAPGFFSSTSR